jgi:hypothetical protein
VGTGLDPTAKLEWIRSLAGCVVDFKGAEAVLAGISGLEWVFGLALFTAKRLWRHI